MACLSLGGMTSRLLPGGPRGPNQRDTRKNGSTRARSIPEQGSHVDNPNRRAPPRRLLVRQQPSRSARAMADHRKAPILGVAIAAALALYAIAADRRCLPARAARAVDDRMGRAADEPHQIPAAGWWDILKRQFPDIRPDTVSLMPPGTAFYGPLSRATGPTTLV